MKCPACQYTSDDLRTVYDHINSEHLDVKISLNTGTITAGKVPQRSTTPAPRPVMRSDAEVEELYQATDATTIAEWIEACESAASCPACNGGVSFSEREREFLRSVRQQYDDRVAEGRRKPLSGKQLSWLKTLYDRT